MNLLTAIVRSKRPSRINDMPASVNSFLCRKGYSGITLFGRIFTNEQGVADSLNGRYTVMKNHEMIHLRQAQSTGNNWFAYYTIYGFFWLRGIFLNRKRRNLAYYLNPFEMEAYLYEDDLHYLEQFEKGATGWRELRKMSFPQRYRLMRSNNKIPF